MRTKADNGESRPLGVKLWPSILITCGMLLVFSIFYQKIKVVLKKHQTEALNNEAQFITNIFSLELGSRIKAHTWMVKRWRSGDSRAEKRWLRDSNNYIKDQKGLKALFVTDSSGNLLAIQESPSLSNSESYLPAIIEHNREDLDSWNFEDNQVFLSFPPRLIVKEFQPLMIYSTVDLEGGKRGFMGQLVDIRLVCLKIFSFLGKDHEIMLSNNNQVLFTNSDQAQFEISDALYGTVKFSLSNFDVFIKLKSPTGFDNNPSRKYLGWFGVTGFTVSISFGIISYLYHRSRYHIRFSMREIEKREEVERARGKITDDLKSVNQELEDQRIAAFNMAQDAETARKNALENQRFLDAVIDHLPVMVFVKDAKNLNYVKFNRAGERLTGYSQKDLLGKNDFDFFPDEQADFFIEKDRETLRGEATIEIPHETISTRIKGNRVLRTLKVPIRDDRGKPQYLLGISEDITERMRYEEKIKRLSERLKLATRAAKIGIWDWNIKTDELVWDDRMFEIYDIDKNQFSGIYDAWKATLHPDDRERAEKELSDSLSGTSFDSEFRIFDSHRSIRHIKAYGTIERSSTNEALRIVGINFDISSIRKAEERFKQVVEAAPSGMVMVDSSGKIVLVNAKAEEMFSYERDELYDRSIEILVPKRFCNQHPDYRTKFFLSPESRAMGAGRDLFGRRKDGTEFPVEIGLNPVESEEGKFVLSSVVDITERKKAEKQLKASAAELQRSNEELDQFAYVASHDLKAPLRGIDNISRWIIEDLGDSVPEETRGHLSKLQQRVTRMERLLDDLLAYARAGKISGSIKQVNLNTLVDDVIEVLALPEGFNVEIIGTLPTINAYQSRLELVLRNLIGNAVKHHDQSTGLVQISAKENGHFIEFSVSDNGPGISRKYHERIFEMFKTLKPRDEVEGSGMGLAVVKKTIANQGGTIHLESDGTRGSCFFFSWPKKVTLGKSNG